MKVAAWPEAPLAPGVSERDRWVVHARRVEAQLYEQVCEAAEAQHAPERPGAEAEAAELRRALRLSEERRAEDAAALDEQARAASAVRPGCLSATSRLFIAPPLQLYTSGGTSA